MTNQDTTLTNQDSDKDMMGGIKVDDLEKMAKDGYPRPALSLAYGQGLIVGINRAKEKFKAATKASEQRIQELTASNNQLREALSDTNTRFNEMVDVFYKGATAKDRAVVANNYDLLSATTSSLVEHDNDVIERIATALENAEGELKTLPEYVSLVRALKATP